MPLHLKWERQRQETLIASELKALQPCGELKLRAHPSAPTLNADAAPFRKSELHGDLRLVLIQTEIAPARGGQAESCWSDPNPGRIGETYIDIQAGRGIALWERTWHPVSAIGIPAQIKVGSPNPHREHRPQPLQAGQRVETNAEALNPGTRLIKGSFAELNRSQCNSLQTQTAIAAHADGMAEGVEI